MAQAHDLLTARSWTSAHLTDVVERVLKAFAPTQVDVSGAAIEVSPKHALAISMALHELATNAIKYGALSCPEGRITVQWRVQKGMLYLDWEERGGPPVAPPTRKRIRQPAARTHHARFGRGSQSRLRCKRPPMLHYR